MTKGKRPLARLGFSVGGAATVALLACGCGGSASQAQRRTILSSIRAYVIAVDTNNAAAACKLVTPTGQEAAVDKVNALVKSGQFGGLRPADNCVQAFRGLHPGGPKRPGLSADPLAFAQLDKAHVTITGVSATVAHPVVPVVDFGAAAALIQTHGAWLLAELT
jgi:hypothetical protein